MASKKRPRDVDVHVGARVRVARQVRKITQQGLAHQLGIAFQQVQKYESGANRMSVGRLYHVAEIMKLPIAFFFDGVDAYGKVPSAVSRANRFLGTREGMLIAAIFPQVGKRTRQAIFDLMKAGGRR